MTQMTKLAPCKLKKLAQDLVKCWPEQSAKRVARKHGLRLRFISDGGIDRCVFLISGTNTVLKLSEDGESQSVSELHSILKIHRMKKLRPYLPKIYLYGCIVKSGTSVIAMRYYPRAGRAKDADMLEDLFTNTGIVDFHKWNVCRTKSGCPKLIDLGY